MKNVFLILTLFLTLSSCIGSKIMSLENKSKNDMLNKLGAPYKIIYRNNGESIYVYFYDDISVNDYPSIVGLFYISSNNKINSVQKTKTRLTLEEFLNYNNIK